MAWGPKRLSDLRKLLNTIFYLLVVSDDSLFTTEAKRL